MREYHIPDFECGGAQLVVPKAFSNCYSYEMQLMWLFNRIQELEKRVEELEELESKEV